MENNLSAEYLTRVVDAALEDINANVFGKRLLQMYPAITVSPTFHASEYRVLQKYGSPACTDGKNVFISLDQMRDILSKTFSEWDASAVRCSSDRDRLWAGLRPKADTEYTIHRGTEMIREVRDIIYHELTHAMNEHTKLQRRAAKFSDEYQQKLAIACELQANDGIAGANYAMNYTQQLQGVTNKYKHRECVGYHTLREFMEHIELTQDEKMEAAMKKIMKSARASQEMAEATGAAKKMDEEIAKEGNEQDGKGGKFREEELTERENKDSEQKLTAKLKSEGLRNIKKLILATISDELKYDAATDSVIYNKVRKRVAHKTYARPSKRGDIELCRGVKIVRKGRKITRETVFDKTRDLTILAVDASGSMEDQEQYVSAILDDLLRQVEKVAAENGLEVNYDNMRGMLHTEDASDLMVITSEKWARTMRNYRADGGNDFDCVLRKVRDELDATGKQYETINIINLSDAMGYLSEDFSATSLGTYIARKRLHWIDAMIVHPQWMRDINECCAHDRHAIRTQEIIAVAGEDF